MSKISPLLALVMLFTVLPALVSCGNKGDLYRESDAAALEELQQAAEKLKKNKKQSGQPSSEDSATGN